MWFQPGCVAVTDAGSFPEDPSVLSNPESQVREAELLLSILHNLGVTLNTRLNHHFSVPFLFPGYIRPIHTKNKHLQGLCSEHCEETLLAYLFLKQISSKTKRIVAEALPQLRTRSVTQES